MASSFDQANDSLQQGEADKRWPRWESFYNKDLDSSSPWAKKVIVSLDGGGVRGYASLEILEKLMRLIIRYEESSCKSSGQYDWCTEERSDRAFRLHHYVDYFAGTSTGGLSAIMLGPLKMTVEHAQRCYRVVGDRVFARPRKLDPTGLFRRRLESKQMELALMLVSVYGADAVTKKPKMGEMRFVERDARMKKLLCNNLVAPRTMLFAYGEDSTKSVHMFRSYDHFTTNEASGEDAAGVLSPGHASDIPLFKVARATTAAPTYFDSVTIQRIRFRDGALGGANNPVRLAYNEVKQMHSGRAPWIIISVGTGMRNPKPGESRWKLLSDLKRAFKEGIANSDRTHRSFKLDVVNKSDIEYYRFDLPPELDKGIPHVKLVDWKGNGGTETLDDMKEKVKAYVETREIETQLEDLAEKLVKLRHRRQLSVRWEQYAHDDIRYHCPLRTEGDFCTGFLCNNRFELRSHLVEHHSYIWPETRNIMTEEEESTIKWVCNQGACEEKIRLFGEINDLRSHLIQAHGRRRVEMPERADFERLLDQGRIDPNASSQPMRRQTTVINGDATR